MINYKVLKILNSRSKKYSPLKPIFKHLKNSSGHQPGNQIADAFITLDKPSDEFHTINETCIKPCLFSDAPAGAKMHHFWPNGLWQHMGEMWTLANQLYRDTLDGLHTRNNIIFDFNLDDVAICILLHDLSKGIAFQWKEFKKVTDPVFSFEYRKGFFNELSYDNKTQWLMARFGIVVTQQQLSAILHTEGGWADLAKSRKDGNMLGKFMHVLDLYSSQILGGRYTPVKKFITVS